MAKLSVGKILDFRCSCIYNLEGFGNVSINIDNLK